MAELYIKNMVCRRCVQVVDDLVKKAGLQPTEVALGYVKLNDAPRAGVLKQLAEELSLHGFELLDTAKKRVIEQIKTTVINKIHHSDALDLKVNWSSLIAGELNQDYDVLSGLFSSVEGITLEQYIIRQKIERVKELLFYGELTLSGISYKLGYSSVAHLSSQFKKTTGQTPSQFKQSRQVHTGRKPLDGLTKDV